MNAVWCRAEFSGTSTGSSRASSRCPMTGIHTSPLACLAIKLICAGDAFSAAMTKSPSFSRSLSSTTITNLPSLTSLMISGTVASGIWHSIIYVYILSDFGVSKASAYLAKMSISMFTEDPSAFMLSVVCAYVYGITAIVNAVES